MGRRPGETSVAKYRHLLVSTDAQDTGLGLQFNELQSLVDSAKVGALPDVRFVADPRFAVQREVTMGVALDVFRAAKFLGQIVGNDMTPIAAILSTMRLRFCGEDMVKVLTFKDTQANVILQQSLRNKLTRAADGSHWKRNICATDPLAKHWTRGTDIARELSCPEVSGGELAQEGSLLVATWPDGTRMRVRIKEQPHRAELDSMSMHEAREIASSIRCTKQDLVRHRVSVYWPDDDLSYSGCVMSYNSDSGEHLVMYDDGTSQAEQLDEGEDQMEWKDLVVNKATQVLLDANKEEQRREAQVRAAARQSAEHEEFQKTSKEMHVFISTSEQQVRPNIPLGRSAFAVRLQNAGMRPLSRQKREFGQRVQLHDAQQGGDHASLQRHVRRQLRAAESQDEQGYIIGSNHQAEKFSGIFRKFSQCQEIFEAPRALCKHEVAAFQARCLSIGHYFPHNFPEASTRRTKFHILTHVMPKVAVRHKTIGLSTEQVIEVLHAVWNRRRHLYWSIKNPVKKLEAQVKDAQRQSYAMNTTKSDLKEIKTRKSPQVKMENTQFFLKGPQMKQAVIADDGLLMLQTFGGAE